MSRRAPRCPDCTGAPLGVPLVYGLPSSEAFEAAERGQIVLAGCLMEPGLTPSWACPECQRPLGREATSFDIEIAAPEAGLTRIATWNLRGCPSPGYPKGAEVARWQEKLSADIWLLTEIHRDWNSSSGWASVSDPRGGDNPDTKRAPIRPALQSPGPPRPHGAEWRPLWRAGPRQPDTEPRRQEREGQ